ncbi:hypothetical protein NDU88_002723 [Pleurodeles waltl]|uniref:Uncharacterized protein n=1 Tax=Pleurodeles waltl TaxID=8319 RepID=A0AAV7VE38_PLEWA|nr:hypothetical protein NDU88_002723 [Pleurodeles waltl]
MCATPEPRAIGRGDRALVFERRRSGRRPSGEHKDTLGGGGARARELATPGGAGISAPPAWNSTPGYFDRGPGGAAPPGAPGS